MLCVFSYRPVVYVQVVFSSGGRANMYGEMHEWPPQRNRCIYVYTNVHVHVCTHTNMFCTFMYFREQSSPKLGHINIVNKPNSLH